MFSHVHLGTNNFEAAFGFYAPLFEALRHGLRFRDRAKPWTAWQPAEAGRPLLIVGVPFDGGPAVPGNGQMVALLAPSRAAFREREGG